MDTRWRVIAVDVGWAWLPAFFFLFNFGLIDDALWSFLGPVSLVPILGVALLVAGGKYRAERHGTPLDEYTDNPVVVIGAAVVVAVPAMLFINQYPNLGTSAVIAGAFGLALGMTGYRIVYGVVRPVPQRRLERLGGTAESEPQD
jgi:hypothetical protein